MAEIGQLRQGLATNLATISGLRVNSTIKDSIAPPTAVVYPSSNPVEYHQASINGHALFNFEVMIIVGRADADASQKALDAYISTTGTKSILTAIELDKTLGGIAFDTVARRVSSYGSTEINNIEYMAATIEVEVIAS